MVFLQLLVNQPVAQNSSGLRLATAHSDPDLAKATTSHGFALWDDLKYPADFSHFDYVNPNAPGGGEVRLLGYGTFDSLNPYILKGTSPYNSPGFFLFGINELNETLLVGTAPRGRSGDEAQAAYGLIAESVSYPEDLAWVRFNLRPQAHFHDGEPITAADVLFSYETLVRDGHPRYRQLLAGIERVEADSSHAVIVHLKTPGSRKDVLRFGELPVLPEHYWRDKDFAKSSLDIPLLSGPYKIDRVTAGQQIVYQRVDDYWGKELAVNRGKYNFDRVRVDFYRDQTVAFEAFKAKDVDIYMEYTSKNWAVGYDFPAVNNGQVTRVEIPHQLPSNVQAIFLNSRRPPLDQLAFRKALALLFDFEWTNKQLFYDAYTRTRSFFPNSSFAAPQAPPTGAELQLLKTFANQLPEDLFKQPIEHFETDASGNIRPQMKRAFALFKEAGYTLKNRKLVNSKTGKPVTFELLFRQKGIERVLLPYTKNLKRVGIDASLRLVDSAQYKNRLDAFDFDMTTFVLPQSHAPGHELYEMFHSASSKIKGQRNYAGIQHPVVDQLVEKAIQATTKNELTVTLQALDRILLWQHYVVPNWHINSFRTAYWQPLMRPSEQAPFIFGFENWWFDR